MKKFLLITTIVLGVITFMTAVSFSQNWENRLFSMEFRDVDLKDVVRVFSKETGLNIIFNDEFNKKVTISFKRVTLKNAFESLLKSQGLSYVEENGILILTKEDISLKENKLTTVVYPVQYQNIKDMGIILSKTISKEGAVVADEGTSSIIIKDYPQNHIKIKKLLAQLDTKTPQILIEARIIETSKKYAEQFGIQWGFGVNRTKGTPTISIPGTDNANTPVKSITSSSGGTASGSAGTSPNYTVNLPATAAFGGLGLTLGSLFNAATLDIQLSAMEENGAGKILSSPKILTLNNKEAKITAGSVFYVRSLATTGTSTTGTSSTAGASTTSSAGAVAGTTGTVTTGLNQIEATLELSVTPRVTETGDVQLKIKTLKQDADFGRAIENIPAINKRSAETQLIVKDGETIVIGGIIQDTKGKTEESVPFFSKIPIIGWLFKNERKNDEAVEMIIFITPRIAAKSAISAN